MTGFRSLLRSFPVLIGAVFLACQGDEMPDPDGMGGMGGEGGGGPGSEVTRTLGQEGGELSSSNASIVVPAGALPKNTELTVSDLDEDDIEALPSTTEGVKLVGFPSKFTPHGLTFEQPVDVDLSYPPPEDEDTPIVAMKLENDQDMTWELIPDAEFESGTASFKIDGFSYYACFEDPNGVAEMLYGPDVSGSGGAGSGGAGSGGEGSGGEGSGGEAAGGSPTGGSGGTASGGNGSGGGNENGYLDTPTFKGYGYLEPGAGASMASNVETAPGPNCADGSTGATLDGQASLVYYVNQGTDGIELGEYFVPDAGVRIDITNNAGYRPYLLELRAEPGVWCAHIPMEVSGPQFLAWSDFDAANCPGDLVEDAFDPLTDGIVKVAVTVPSNGDTAEAFDYCIEELTAGLPNGYMNGPSWYGQGFLDSFYAVVDHDLNEELFPNCITGTTDASALGYAGLAYNLDEPAGGGSPNQVTVQGTGLELDLLMSVPGRDLQVRLMNSYYGTAYCASIPDSDTGPYTVPWDDFVDCDSGAQFVPVSAPIDAISVRVLSSGVANDPFDLCIERLEEDIPID